MDVTRGIQFVDKGNYGFVLRMYGKNGKPYVVKVFKHTIDQELGFLGLEYDHTRRQSMLNHERRDARETCLVDSGFTPTILRACTKKCPICTGILTMVTTRRSGMSRKKAKILTNLEARVRVLLSKRLHYHTIMPAMEGNLYTLLKTRTWSMIERLGFFIEVAKSCNLLRQHGVINADLKLTNVLYKYHNNKYVVMPCDVGGLYALDEPSIHREDEEIRFLQEIPTFGGGIDRVFTSNPILPSTASNKTKTTQLQWATATHVDIYLRARGIESNFDLASTTDLTNQFSVLSFLMTMVGIEAPTFSMATNPEELANTHAFMPTHEVYLEMNHSLVLEVPSAIIELIDKVWAANSSWKLYGTEETYIQHILEAVQTIQHQLIEESSSLT